MKKLSIFSIIFACSLVLSMPFSVQNAYGTSVDVKVTIERLIDVFDDLDDNSDADFYVVIRIDGVEHNNEDVGTQDDFEGEEDISPNWSFTSSVDISKGSIPIVIQVWDEDDLFNGADEHADADPGSGKNVDLTLTFGPCSISGEVNGSCNATLTSEGNDSEERAKIFFKIELLLSNGPGLQIHCLHSPIWPQPGEDITITAVALDDNLQPKQVDTLEILVTTDPNPASSVTNDFATAATVDPSETDFMYLCRAADGGSDVDTDWRELDVGTETGKQAISILSTGFFSDSEDIVFIPDSDDYSNSLDPKFLADVHKMIDMYYTGGLVFIENQDKVNFWIAQDTGNHKGFTNGNCNRDLPNSWNTEYTFANAGAILHREALRDCASNGVFSAETIDNNPNDGLPIPFVHEMGHSPFMLADEYCNTRPGANPNSSCDGGYFQTFNVPNIFNNSPDCTTDPDNPTNTCDSFVSQSMSTFGQTFFTYDPPANDLMVDNHLPQSLDDRRINFIFDLCLNNGC